MMRARRREAVDFVTRSGGPDGGRGLWGLLLLVMALLCGFVLWAAQFEIEEVTRAAGRVVPSSQVQSVQAPEAGIVAAIHVTEGDVVHPGQVLFEIDDTAVQSNLGALQQRAQALSAELVRLRAEAVGAAALDFAAEPGWAAELVAAQTAIFDTRQRQLDLEVSLLMERMRQRQAELAELAASRARLVAMAGPLRRELVLTEGLFASGAVPEIDLLRLRGQMAEIDGDIAVAEATEQRLRAGLAETETQIAATQAAYGLAARERISVVMAELAVVEESLHAARDRVSRTDLRAPVRGTVNRVHVSNVGSVVAAAVTLADIVPLDDTLLIEAQVSPRDLAFVRVGAPASVKITAYDYLRYGDLPAQVERIGADALSTPEGVPYFQVMLRTKDTVLRPADGAADAETASARTLAISPGMIASIDIQSGRKTVLEYLIRPVLRAQHEALRER